jgi:hypothetical protein
MTQDDMVKVARECGIGLAYGRENIERFYTFVAAAEREACAKVCEETRFPDSYTAIRCAAAIRARGEQEQPR